MSKQRDYRAFCNKRLIRFPVVSFQADGEKIDLDKLFFTIPVLVVMAISGLTFISGLVALMVSIYKRRRWNETSMDAIVSFQ